MQVARAVGCEHIVINSGAKSERLVKQQFPDLSRQAFIQYGNFIGKTLAMASELDFKQVTMGIMIGKAVKLTAGALDTHSKKIVMDKEFLIELARQSACPEEIIRKIREITLARQLWEIIPDEQAAFYSLLLRKCYQVCSPLLPPTHLTIILIRE